MNQDLSQAETAVFLRKSVETLRRWRRTGQGPSYRIVGGSVRYSPDAIDAYLQAQTRFPVDERRLRALDAEGVL